MTGVIGTTLVAAVRVEHAVTGELLGPIEIDVVEPTWSGWTIAYRRGHALLMAAEGLLGDQPEETSVDVRLVDARVRARVSSSFLVGGAQSGAEAPTAVPAPVAPTEIDPRALRAASCGELHRCERATSTPERAGASPLVARLTVAKLGSGGKAEHVVRLEPVASTLEIVLADEQGRPLRGAVVEVRGKEGAPAVELIEADWPCVDSDLAQAAIYRSCPARVWDARYYPFQVVVDGMRVVDRMMSYSTPVTRHRLVTPRNLRASE
ncbi:hypothetical protein [Engelhardtia mirabilis]|uniref:Uncharacterized protein n=1 Tax=Engelhardtia mirabilis TaxID=2528011 RepID=A0A518BPN8_9BACT|nr:hypothetical protein Pla133_40550 [Planctomycetes bacterium Pla133]QDV03267.1 hypothetical protein Pla86_40540 [Planctomycetes bacterium Pla86]